MCPLQNFSSFNYMFSSTWLCRSIESSSYILEKVQTTGEQEGGWGKSLFCSPSYMLLGEELHPTITKIQVGCHSVQPLPPYTTGSKAAWLLWQGCVYHSKESWGWHGGHSSTPSNLVPEVGALITLPPIILLSVCYEHTGMSVGVYASHRSYFFHAVIHW